MALFRALGCTVALHAPLLWGLLWNSSSFWYVCRAGMACPPLVRMPFCTIMMWGFRVRNPLMDLEREAAMHRAVLARRKAGGRPTVLVLGANIMSEDVDYLREYAAASYDMILVEPQPFLRGPLEQQLLELGAAPGRARIAHVAACPEDEGDVTLHLAGRTEADQKFRRTLHWHQASSLTRVRGMNDSMQVRCLGPASLLGELGVQAGAVDVLHMDIEGHDVKVLESFLRLEGFAPAVLTFEWVIVPREEATRMINLLASRGYDVHKDTLDLVALAAPPPAEGAEAPASTA